MIMKMAPVVWLFTAILAAFFCTRLSMERDGTKDSLPPEIPTAAVWDYPQEPPALQEDEDVPEDAKEPGDPGMPPDPPEKEDGGKSPETYGNEGKQTWKNKDRTEESKASAEENKAEAEETEDGAEETKAVPEAEAEDSGSETEETESQTEETKATTEESKDNTEESKTEPEESKAGPKAENADPGTEAETEPAGRDTAQETGTSGRENETESACAEETAAAGEESAADGLTYCRDIEGILAFARAYAAELGFTVREDLPPDNFFADEGVIAGDEDYARRSIKRRLEFYRRAYFESGSMTVLRVEISGHRFYSDGREVYYLRFYYG